jgi:hypothetical protein
MSFLNTQIAATPSFRVAGDMRDALVCILACYNERSYLPAQLEYLDRIGAKVIAIDNCSDDGSWEYLQENKIPSVRLDTDGRFDLQAIQRERERIAYLIQPRWIIYGDVDEFSFHADPSNLARVLARCETEDCNALRVPSFNLFNTGEPEAWTNLALHYLHGRPRYHAFGGIIRIHRFHPQMQYYADSVRFPGLRVSTHSEGVNCNYGDTKPAKIRDAILMRRRLAWSNGLPAAFGVHYLEGERKGWRWSKSELLDIRTTEFWPYIERHFDSQSRPPRVDARISGQRPEVESERSAPVNVAAAPDPRSATKDGRKVPVQSGARPWMHEEEIEILEQLLRPNDRVLEFGCGGSTLWLAHRVKEVHSVEHDQHWAARLNAVAPGNVNIHWRRPLFPSAPFAPAKPGQYVEYLQIPKLLGLEFDVCVVDGRARVDAAVATAPFLKSGGWLFFHDWFNRPRYTSRAAELAHDFEFRHDLSKSQTPQTLAVFQRR